MKLRSLIIAIESFPLAQTFTISRGSKTEAHTLTVTIEQDELRGRGECIPYARYGEDVASVSKQIEALSPRVEAGLSLEELQALFGL